MKLEPAARAKLQSILDDPNESPRAKKAIRLALKAIDAPSNAGRPGISDELRQKIVDAFNAREPRKDIAARLGIGLATITRVLQAAGLVKPRARKRRGD